ncbi:hypothetical protein BST61_g4697 [Cercospora zeina]
MSADEVDTSHPDPATRHRNDRPVRGVAAAQKETAKPRYGLQVATINIQKEFAQQEEQNRRRSRKAFSQTRPGVACDAATLVRTV